jgi:hypothetical protein
VEELAANPERIKELRANARTDRAKLGDELCNRVAEAANGASSVTPEQKSVAPPQAVRRDRIRAVTSTRRNALALAAFLLLRHCKKSGFLPEFRR